MGLSVRSFQTMTTAALFTTGASNGLAPQQMARLVYVGRSDGRWYTTEDINARKGPVKQVGEPIPEDLNQIPDEETKRQIARWKVLVATGLSDELGWPKSLQYQLVFPESFCLRWNNPAGPQREICMYGHPQDCSEAFLYKHPHEFIPHVLWLLSDSADHQVCPCKPCHRATGRKVPRSLRERMEEEIAAKEAATQVSAAVETKPPRKTAATKVTATTKKKASAAAAAAATSSPSSTATAEAGIKANKEPPAPKTTKKAAAAKTAPAVPASGPALATTPAVTPTATPAIPPAAPPTAPSIATPTAPPTAQPTVTPVVPQVPPPAAVLTPAVQPTPAPPVPHPSINDEPTLFRRGEMVWYQQDPAWRIGIIRQVGLEQIPTYTVVPLGHALLGLPDVVKQQGQMRPFLTFSVPAISIEPIQNKIFSQVDWQALMENSTMRSEVVGLEASKMAAIEIDGSWSTFNRLPAGPKQPKNQSLYGGVFLGAEMVRLGDPIRAKDKSRNTLLEVTEISVSSNTTVPNPSDPVNTPSTTQHTLTFRGIEYEAAIVPEHGRIAAQPEGAIFTKDTAFRTTAAKVGGGKLKCVWTIKSWDTTWLERDVAGRSYVTNELIGVTQGAAALEEVMRTGNIVEASAYLNNRMQNAAARNFGRRPNRRVTVGAAVSPAQPLVLGEGVFEE